MRKLLLFSLLFLPLLGCYAQGKLEKVFDEAIKNGLNSNGVYHISNSKKKDIDASEMASYVENKGYMVLNGASMNVHRFGDVSVILNYLDFTDEKHYPWYAYKIMEGDNYQNLKSKGSVFLTELEKVYRKTSISFVSVLSGSINRLKRYDDVLWTGNVSNGLLEGSGTGFIIQGLGQYISFQGTFEHGLPTSDFNVKKVSKNLKKKSKDGLDISSSEVKKENGVGASVRVCAQNMDTSDSQLKGILKQRIVSLYDESAQKLEAAYQKSKSLSISNYTSFSPDAAVGEFVAIYDEVKHDPKNLLPKAHEVLDAYKMIPALNLKIRESYYGVNLWSILTMNYEWFNKFVDADREVLSTGLDIAKKRKDNSNFGFKNFFNECYTRLDKKYTEFNAKVDADYKEYSRKHSSIAAEHAEAHERMSHEIDWDHSTEPSGELVSLGFIFTSGYTYEDDGEIRTKTGGEYCKYNVVFDSDKNFDHYVVHYSSKKISNYLNGKSTFKSRGELVEYITNAIR